jgi:hypothetical protein
MELIPGNEVFQTDKRNTKKMFLNTDAICVKCGIIFNKCYDDDCIVCQDKIVDYPNSKYKEGNIIKHVEKIRQQIKKIDHGQDKELCNHEDVIIGRQSVDLRILLDFNMEDLKALCELHGCSEGGRGKMVVNIMNQLYPSLDKRINENLVRKMMFRNRKKFRFWKDIEDAVNKAKKPGKIKIVSADDCLEITEIGKRKSTTS